MSYLGRGSNLTRKAQDKVSFLATAGQTVKTGLSYVPTHVDVTVNGITLTEITDYTATNGNSITFTVALALNDEVTIVSSKTFDVANHYTISAANALLAAKATNTAVALKSPIASPVFTGPLTSNSAAATNIIAKSTNGNGGYMNFQGLASNGTQTFGVNHNGTIFTTSGLAVGGTGAANTLTDFETGTFTPAWATTSGAQPTVGYSSRFGHYVKVGRLVTIRIEMYMNALTVNGATSSVLIINNLPFALANPAASVGSNTSAYFSWARARSELTGYGATEVGFLGTVARTGNAQAWNWETISALRSNSEFRATIQYETNS